MPPGTPTSLDMYFPDRVSEWFSLQSTIGELNVSTTEHPYKSLIHSYLPVELQAHCQQDNEAVC
jgi:hypothetical protein